MTSAANQDADILLSGQARVFIQKNGISPASPYLYYGCVSLGGPEQDLGEPDPVYCPSSAQRNRWDIVGSVPKTQALGTTDFTQRASRLLKDVWWELKRKGCNFNLYAVMGACTRPDDFSKWDAKLLLRSTRLTNIALGELNTLSGDDNAPVDLTGSLTFEEMEPITSLVMGEVADTVTVAEILDGFYNDVAQCGECGTASDGCQKSYWLAAANSGSPGLSGQLIHSSDDSTFTTIDIDTLGGLSPNRMAAVGSKLVVVSQATGSHHWSEFTDIDNDTQAWTEVTSGYVAGKSPRAIYSKSASETYIAASGGYVYFMSDPTLAVTVLSDGSVTTQDLNDIHGFGRTIVAVGNSNAIMKSDNAGDTWTAVTGPAVGVSLSAIWVLSTNIWFVGTGSGALYYTLNGGTTWTQINLASGITTINDIQFANDTVGYMAVEIAGAGRIYRTTDSGYSWQYQAPSISGVPTAQRYNVVAPCGLNKVGAGGRKTVGGDGIIAIGA